MNKKFIEESVSEQIKLPTLKDSDEFIWVNQNTFGVTSSERDNPVLKTLALGPCVGVVLYHRTSGVAVMGHSTHSRLDRLPIEQKAHSDLLKLLYALYRNGISEEKKSEIETYIVTASGEDLASGFRQKMDMVRCQSPKMIVTNVKYIYCF